MSKDSAKDYAIALWRATQNADEKQIKEVVKNLSVCLSVNHNLKMSKQIIKEFIAYEKEQNGIVDIKIRSARELDQKTVKQIKLVFGENVESVEAVDKDLIGGLIIQMKDKILDASIKTQLNKLKQVLS